MAGPGVNDLTTRELAALGELAPEFGDEYTDLIAAMTTQRSRPAVKTHTRQRGYIENYRPQAKTLVLLEDVAAVLSEYRAHWPLTVRQIYYRLIGAHGYPKTESFYERLCEHMANARRARRIPFRAIRDDGVSVIADEHFADPDDFWAKIRGMGADYTRDKLAHQDRYIEVWCEAAGMQPQLARVAGNYSIGVYSSSGFDSLTAKKDIAERVCDAGKSAVILHLGDYDPSGEAIFGALAQDVRAFVLADRIDARIDVEFRRVALIVEQVESYNLPTTPAKASDSRSARWGRRETCQLEALAPDDIAALLNLAIQEIIDLDVLEADADAEEGERQQIAYLLPAGGPR
jgi:hypothetical protein